VAVLMAVLGAAVLHAVWNALAHGVPDRLGGFALIGLSSGLCGLVAVMVTGMPPAGAWPYILASVVLHLAYQAGLLASYQLGQFSQVYPLARGYVALGGRGSGDRGAASEAGTARVGWGLLISAGLFGLVLIGGLPSRRQAPALLAAFGTGLLIAAYTVVDGVAVHKIPLVSYMGWVFMLQGLIVPVFVLIRRGPGFLVQARGYLWAGLGGGVVSLVAYGLVLWAQTRGALAAMAALQQHYLRGGDRCAVLW